MNMKFLQLLLLVCLCGTLHAQNAKIEELEAKLKLSKGIDFARTANELSSQYYRVGDTSKAIERAQRAHDMASELGNNNVAAQALTHEARGLLSLNQAKARARARAIERLTESNRITTSDRLRLENLNILLDIVPKREVADIETQIRLIRSESIAENFEEPDQNNPIFGKKRKEAEAELARTKEVNEVLTSEVDNLAAERRRLQELRERMETTINRQNNAIASMTEEQAKAELNLARQRQLLDSLTFEGQLDSLRIIQDSIQLMQVNTEKREVEATARASASQRNFLLAAAASVLLLAFGFYYRWNKSRKFNRELETKNEEIEAERQRSEDLLLNILPAAVASELKETGFAKAHSFQKATVLFTDFKNFSRIAAQLSPEELVKDLDHCFRNFDRIVDKHGLEKIKTIGDSYMCAGGLPATDDAHPANVVKAALEMQKFLRKWNQERKAAGKPKLEARIGIHTGPVVAGVVGERKYAYDIWGDTVNIASRMESSGEAGRVNVSETTYALTKEQFKFTSRGKIPAKSIGEVEMFFVE